MKQAVILIHGVGEQKPNQTLRNFVKAVVGDSEYYNKPARVGCVSELRKLKVIKDRAKGIPDTDFYELYWAHNIPNVMQPIISWAIKVLVNSIFVLRDNLSVVLWLVATFIVLSFIGVYCVLTEYDIASSAIVKTAASAVVPYLTASFVYNYLGKAASYLNPAPSNVNYRQTIREEGFSLLLALHKLKKYSRIIVVGHSLGSVIGYDIIRQYWSFLAVNNEMGHVDDAVVKGFRNATTILSSENAPEGERVELFQQAQHKFWRELRKANFPWLITDFITIGSPLAHAPLLLSETIEEFTVRKIEREYAECPPIDCNKRAVMYDLNKKSDSGIACVSVPEDDCPFACTRWVNIYFDNKYVVYGDPIGGPLQKYFGKGIKDIKIESNVSWHCHNLYWKEKCSSEDPCTIAKKKLISHMKLESLFSKQAWPEP